jgi:SAM-dependent methyltransferase
MTEFEIINPPDTVSMNDDWYEVAGENHFWIQWRLKIVCNAIKNIGAANILNALDIGCGTGVMSKLLENIFPVTIDGCDLNQVALINHNSGRGKNFCYNILSLKLTEGPLYDAAFLFDVIEHLDDDKTFLKAAAKHVKPGGYIIGNVPALNSLYSTYDEVVGHKRRYNKLTIEHAIYESELTLIDNRYWGLTLIPFLFLRKFYSNIIPKNKVISSGLTPPNILFDRFLKFLFRLETALFNNPPIGTSIVFVARVR